MKTEQVRAQMVMQGKTAQPECQHHNITLQQQLRIEVHKSGLTPGKKLVSLLVNSKHHQRL